MIISWCISFSIASPATLLPPAALANGRQSMCRRRRRRRRSMAMASSRNESLGEEAPRWDVSSTCVQPVFRSSPALLQPDLDNDRKVQIFFLSEGNICRSIFAEAIFRSLVQKSHLQDMIWCTSKGTKDYNEGEHPDDRVVQVAEEFGLHIRKDKVATVFSSEYDVMKSDLILVMDKFTASDVLKEITIQEAIDKRQQHSHKVRRLGEFCTTKTIGDIDDPLYGNRHGPEELVALRRVYREIEDSCNGLLHFLSEIQSSLQGSETLKQGIAKSLGCMNTIDWLVPPMLQKQQK